ncbi:MAG: hypothetical protein AMS26_00815 [Bacteroides sp. SM23_62]|nr:MAG: hypothetical protein AMS26_00815 [Bacteroides sp. SM23_62]
MVRFSPNEKGEYTYQLFVNDAGGKGESAVAKFAAIDSEHHGWIRPSTVNPHYFVHDDGTAYYGVGVYSPWGNDMQRFDNFAEHNATLFAIWDITYGGFIHRNEATQSHPNIPLFIILIEEEEKLYL